MKAVRSMIEYFDKSTQAMAKLIKIQEEGGIKRYKNQAKGLKVIQDCITRWWSTWRMCKRVRWLQLAIMSLHGAKEITCDVPSDLQWEVIYQVEITLQTMSGFQRMLEGECYVTGSMVVFAVFQIRKAFVTVLECEATLEPVKELTQTLLDDFDTRYHPSDEEGKVKYESKARVGHRQRYITVHPYYFIASFLDPRVRGMLSGDDEDIDYFMSVNDYTKLKSDVLKLMIEEKKKMVAEDNEAAQEKTSNETVAEEVRKTIVFVFPSIHSI